MRFSVCGYDVKLHAKKQGRVHVLSPATVDEALSSVGPWRDEALERTEWLDAPLERPDDCSLPCYRHGGTDACVCEEDSPGTTAAPGGW